MSETEIDSGEAPAREKLHDEDDRLKSTFVECQFPSPRN